MKSPSGSIVIPLLFIACCLLSAGCGTAARHTPTPEIPKAAAETSQEEAVQISPYSWKNRILEAAAGEWIYFGQQKVIFEQDEESIPHVGIWEDEDPAHIGRVNDYWRAVGIAGLTGRDCAQPWSAAFISWLMQAAGVPETLFPPAKSHRGYLIHFLSMGQSPEAIFVPHTLRSYKPKPGDLICAHREAGFPDEDEQLPQPETLASAKLHCDIVVEIGGRTLQAIGGNVRNSVSRSILTLTPEGYLQPAHHRHWFLVIENRLDSIDPELSR